MDRVLDLLKDFWQQVLSVVHDVADWIVSVIEPSSGPWPKIFVGLVFLLAVLIVVSKTSRPR